MSLFELFFKERFPLPGWLFEMGSTGLEGVASGEEESVDEFNFSELPFDKR